MTDHSDDMHRAHRLVSARISADEHEAIRKLLARIDNEPKQYDGWGAVIQPGLGRD
jgi:hypothetical protein